MMHDDRGHPLRDGAGDGPVDLSALFGDRATRGAPDRWEALAARIEAAASPELARRAARSGRGGGLLDGVAGVVARFAGPALIAAAAAIVIAVGATGQGDGLPAESGVDVVASADASAESLTEETVRQALGADPAAADSGSYGVDELVRTMYGPLPERGPE